MAVDHQHLTTSPRLHGTRRSTDVVRAARLPGRSPARYRTRLRELSQEEAEVLEALSERMIPGARQAGVVEHIDRMLAQTLGPTEGLPAPLEVYRTGVALLQRHATTRYGRPVQDLEGTQVDEILWDMLDGAMDGFVLFSPLMFFRTLRHDTAEAMEHDLV